IHLPEHKISAHGVIHPGNYTPDGLFEPNILEMYKDGKEFMKKRLKIAAEVRNIPELDLVDVDECSIFARGTGFHVNVDDSKFSEDDIKARNEIASEVYHSLEEKLRTKFGIASENVNPNYILGLYPSGTAKELVLPNGVVFSAESPAEDEVGAGTLYMRVISNEDGKKEFHGEVVDFCFDYINRNFGDKLQSFGKRGVVNLGLSGDGTLWNIDLSNVKESRKLTESVFAKYLQESSK
ncbi:hypothetical protein GOV06_05905, partial [Candidatus Woesearchaeota archaeon]|nr:hypothetical protein [Candidatus Woesearchaeota archaeon]